MTPARLKKLEDIGFIWSTRNSKEHWARIADTSLSDRWEKQYHSLLEYIKEHNGSTMVPKQYPPNQPLAYWVSRQRAQYRMKREGQITMLTDERERRLADVGFVFSTKNLEMRRFACLRKTDNHFDESIRRLKIFADEYGHAWGKLSCGRSSSGVG